MRRRFKISDESNRYGPCFVVREWKLTGPILGYQWDWLVWCESRLEAEKFIRGLEEEQ